jgi:chitodextrinase
MKKVILGILLLLISIISFSQGLEDIIVEKVAVPASARDDDPTIPANANSYRVFVDMAAGYEIQAVFSLENHELFFKTTTSFYNNADYGATAGRDILSALFSISPALLYDSYITLNAAANNRLGILRTEDTKDGVVDGLVTGTSLALQTISNDTPFSTAFGTESFSGKFSTKSGIYNVAGGEKGSTTNNRVLIGQFTTDGDFSFEINVQLRKTGTDMGEQYVARDPVGEEIQSSKLTYSSAGGSNPVVSISSPGNGASVNSGESVQISATATDADGSISLVEFFVNGTKIGQDASAPYQFNWIAVTGSAQLTARATDNKGNQTTSTAISITVNSPSNTPPIVSITSPANGATFITGAFVNITANASDADGSVSKVEFMVNGTKVGEDLSAPYSYSWTSVVGNAQITAVATDNSGSHTTSAAVSITVSNQQGGAPTISITSPTSGASFIAGSTVSIAANAADAGGSVTLVEFLVNGTKVGEDATSPYQFNWTAVKGSVTLTARATDNDGNKTLSSAIAITVGDNIAPTTAITLPVNGTTVAAGSQVNITATASDADGTVTLVEFFRNGEKIGEDATAPYQLTWTSVAGICVLTSTATDNNGMKSSSPQILITITGSGGASPVVSITAPANGSVFSAGNTVNINATATDADGTITLVEFYNNSTKIGEDNTAPYSFNWTSVSGNASLTAKATDNSGNQTISAAVSISVNGTVVNHDTLVFDFARAIITNNHYQLPVSVISGRDVTSFSFSTVINTAKIVFDQVINHTSYLVNTNTFDQGTSKLTISSTGTQAVEKNKKLISVSFTLVTGAITPSDLTQFQAYMNNEKCAVKLILTLTNPVVPTVSISSPANGASFTSGTVIPITATAADADGTISLVEFFVNGSKIGEDASAPYQVNWTSIAGSASLTAMATDNKGNQTTSLPVSVTVTGSGNQLPAVSITAPANNAELSAGTVVSITANASDADGSVARVEFYINDVKIGKDATAPYQINWTSVAGNNAIKAISYDNQGAQSAPSIVNVVVNAQPVVTLTSPAEGAEFTAGQKITFIANATSGGGSIVLVEFFVNGVKVGQDDATPYQFEWTSLPGQSKISAMVTDSKGAKTTSGIVTISVNAPPVVELIKPAEGSTFLAGEMINLEATAADADGTITRVEFMVNGTKIGEDLTIPYQFDWKGIEGINTVTAIATDNKGAKETSAPLIITVIIPYELGTVMQPCSVDNFCLPLQVTNPVSDVIGFDIVMKYNANKVLPTGKITLNNDLINSELADYGVNINATNGTIAISVFLKSSAPEGTTFHGTGKLLCVEFSKTPAFLPVDTAVFSVNSLTESYFTGIQSGSVKPGKAITYKDYTFAGSLKYWSDGSPIIYDIANPGQYLVTDITGADPANCSPLQGSAVHPDLSGNFKFDVRNARSIQINRDIDATTQVQTMVNGMDAQLAMKALLGDNTFIPTAYQMIAIDVNLDGAVSSGDISQINQRSILMIKEFKQVWNYNKQGVKIVDKPSKDWLFMNEDLTTSDPAWKISANYPEADGTGYSNSNVPKVAECNAISVSDMDKCPLILPETYMGVMLGDVNGNYGQVAADGKLKSTRAEDATIFFDLSHARLFENKMEFPVYFDAAYSVTSLDFQMNFNLDKLTYDSILYQPAAISSAFFYNPDDSALRYTSYSLSNYPVNSNLIYVRFDLNSGDITPEDFNIPLSLLNGEPVTPVVTEYIPTGLQDNHITSEIQVYPNPANDHVYVQISDEAGVEILDMQGKTIGERVQLVANEKREINTQDLSSGMYLLKFQTKNGFALRKLIINR